METEWYNRAEAIQQPHHAVARLSLTCAGKLKQAAAIEERMAAADFWTNQEKAREAVGELKSLQGR